MNILFVSYIYYLNEQKYIEKLILPRGIGGVASEPTLKYLILVGTSNLFLHFL